MANVYADLIRKGVIGIDDVRPKHKDEVMAILNSVEGGTEM